MIFKGEKSGRSKEAIKNKTLLQVNQWNYLIKMAQYGTKNGYRQLNTHIKIILKSSIGHLRKVQSGNI